MIAEVPHDRHVSFLIYPLFQSFCKLNLRIYFKWNYYKLCDLQNLSDLLIPWRNIASTERFKKSRLQEGDHGENHLNDPETQAAAC